MKHCMMAEASRKPESETHTMVSANKCSHGISESHAAAKDEGRSSKYSQHENLFTPEVRVVYVYEPKIIKTDPENFRSVVQRLTGNSAHKTKEKKKQTNHKNLSSEVISAEVGTENLEYTFDSSDQLPIMVNETSKFSNEYCSALSEGFCETDMNFQSLLNEGLLDGIPLISPNMMNQGFSPVNSPGRLLDQISSNKSKEMKPETNYQTLSYKVIAGTENQECTFYSNDLIPITENKTTKFSSEDCAGFSKGFNDTNMPFPRERNEELVDEIPLVWNNSPFCNQYDQTGVYKWPH